MRTPGDWGLRPQLIRSLLWLALAFGVASSALWLTRVGWGPLVAGWGAMRKEAIPLIVVLTAGNLALRFVRWHFLLRRIAVRIPIRASAAIFFAGLSMIVTPAYVGEILKPILLKRRFGIQVRSSLSVVLVERILDSVALGVLWMAANDLRLAAILLALVAVVLCLAPGLARLGVRLLAVLDRVRQRTFLVRAVSPSAESISRLLHPAILMSAFSCTLLAWSLPCIGLWLAVWASGAMIPVEGATSTFALGTLAGGVTLAPGGVVVVGSVIIARLVALGATAQQAVLATTLFRVLTVGLGLGVGVVALRRTFGSGRAAVSASVAQHFEALASKYDLQLPAHVRDHLVPRKAGGIIDFVRSHAPTARAALEIGCGRGWERSRIEAAGYRVVGTDIAVSQVRLASAGRGPSRLVAADARDLPFADGHFDFAYIVGSLHHIEDREDQRRALSQMARVVKPGGFVFVHETNPRNPLFRFYMGYVFPILRDIDVGSELWLDPRRFEDLPGLGWRETQYFTFLPDFLPKWLFGALAPLESWLEGTRFRAWSVHYLVVLEKRR